MWLSAPLSFLLLFHATRLNKDDSQSELQQILGGVVREVGAVQLEGNQISTMIFRVTMTKPEKTECLVYSKQTKGGKTTKKREERKRSLLNTLRGRTFELSVY